MSYKQKKKSTGIKKWRENSTHGCTGAVSRDYPALFYHLSTSTGPCSWFGNYFSANISDFEEVFAIITDMALSETTQTKTTFSILLNLLYVQYSNMLYSICLNCLDEESLDTCTWTQSPPDWKINVLDMQNVSPYVETQRVKKSPVVTSLSPIAYNSGQAGHVTIF